MIPRAVQFLAVAALGFLAATLLHHFDGRGDTAGPQDGQDRRHEKSDVREGSAEPPFSEGVTPTQEGGSTNVRVSAEDAAIVMARHQDDARSYARNLRIERLRNDGFSDDRIAWLEQRAEELSKQKDEYWRRRAEEGRPAGPSERAVYMFDKDLDLEKEIGEDEYGRYRHGLGRTTGVAVVDVGSGTAGQSLGFMPGDEVVRYDGTRVYSAAMLAYKAESAKPGGQVIVEVRRQGRLVQLSLPSGPMPNVGVHTESPTEGEDRALREAFPRTRPK